jgi:hypothetical protein
VTTALLAGAAVALVVVVWHARQPHEEATSDRLSAVGDEQDRFLGCVRQIGPAAFSLAVSRVVPGDPLRIETYGLVGSGGLILADHMDHTIEVSGTLEPTGDAFPRLRVSSARHVASFCWTP